MFAYALTADLANSSLSDYKSVATPLQDKSMTKTASSERRGRRRVR